MNDFTKEELEDIKYLIDYYESHYGEYAQGLRDKIRHLIDNYCEHEDRAIDIGEAPIICKTCGKVVG